MSKLLKYQGTNKCAHKPTQPMNQGCGRAAGRGKEEGLTFSQFQRGAIQQQATTGHVAATCHDRARGSNRPHGSLVYRLQCGPGQKDNPVCIVCILHEIPHDLWKFGL